MKSCPHPAAPRARRVPEGRGGRRSGRRGRCWTGADRLIRVRNHFPLSVGAGACGINRLYRTVYVIGLRMSGRRKAIPSAFHSDTCPGHCQGPRPSTCRPSSRTSRGWRQSCRTGSTLASSRWHPGMRMGGWGRYLQTLWGRAGVAACQAPAANRHRTSPPQPRCAPLHTWTHYSTEWDTARNVGLTVENGGKRGKTDPAATHIRPRRES